MSRPFMLLFVGRSGSTALMYDLDHHPKTVIHMEIFGGTSLPGGLEQTDENRIALLNRLWAGYRRPEWMPAEMKGCARGFKFQIKHEAPQFDRLGKLARALRLHDAVVIALHRNDVLRQAISSLRAQRLAELSQEERGALDYHIKPESGPRARAFADEPIRISPPDLARALKAMAHNRRTMQRFLERYPAAVEATYEEYLADRLGVLNRVLAALELEPFEDAPPSDLVKVTDDDLSKAVSNYDELRAFADARGLAL